ncbi:MAG: hypothetical protein RLZZ584_2368 [Pseudomonadota bacterium]
MAAPAPRPTPDQLMQRLEWTVLKRLDGLLQGDYRSLWRGAGLDLAELREYQHGDDVRHIDWNVTARLQTPHVRQYREDREVAAWLLLDLSASVDVVGTGSRSKLELAEELVGAMARLMGRHGNPVGAIFYRPAAAAGRPGGAAAAARSTWVLPPRTGRMLALQLVARMRQLAGAQDTAAAASSSPAPGRSASARRAPAGAVAQETRLADLLHAADGVIRRRSVVLLVSDFISAPGWADALGRLARRHDVLAVRLNDELDGELPDLGLVTVQDAETGEQLLVDSGDPAFRQRLAQLAAQHEAELLAGLARAGVDTLELSTREHLLAALLRFVALRRQRMTVAAGPARAA